MPPADVDYFRRLSRLLTFRHHSVIFATPPFYCLRAIRAKMLTPPTLTPPRRYRRHSLI